MFASSSLPPSRSAVPGPQERSVKWHFLCLCSFHTRLYRSAILPILPPPPENTHRDPGPPCPFRPAPGLRGFPQGKKTSGRKLRHLFSTVSGAELEQGAGYSSILLSPGKIPTTLCPLLISQPVTILGLWGKEPQFLSLDRYLENTQACQIKTGNETGGSRVEATDIRSLLEEGEQRYQYSLLYGGT